MPPRKRKPVEEVVDLTLSTYDEAPGPSGRGGGGTAAPPAPSAAAPARRRKARPAAGGGEGPDGAGGSAADAGRKRSKKKEEAGAAKEVRMNSAGKAVKWSAKPAQAVRERMQRALPGSGHRLFLLDRRVLAPAGAEGGAAEEFAVLGATGNVYRCTVGRHPSCTCPDFVKHVGSTGYPCKHLMFVMLRVLRLPHTEPLVWQRGLLAREADEVLSGQKSERSVPSGGVLADQAARAEYRRLSAAQGGGGSQQRLVEGDCPVCFEPLQEGGSAAQRVTFCQACRNNVHQQCIDMWVSSKQREGGEVTCPLCRAPWVDGKNPGGGEPSAYTNLAAHSAAHQQADTSLQALYGDSTMWIHAHRGDMSRGEAAAIWRTRGL